MSLSHHQPPFLVSLATLHSSLRVGALPVETLRQPPLPVRQNTANRLVPITLLGQEAEDRGKGK